MYSVFIELKGLPPMPNAWGRMHRWQKQDQNTIWYAAISAQVGSQKPLAPLTTYRLSLTRKSSSEPDYDGLVGSFKLVVDGLVRCGVLADDKISNSGPWEVGWIRSKQNQGSVLVQVTQVA